MRRLIITITLIIGFTKCVVSQTEQVYQPDSATLLYDHSILEAGETMKFIMSYDNDGVFYQYEQYYSEQPVKNKSLKTEANLKLPLQLRTIYEYDMALNMIRSTEQYYAVPRPPRYSHDYIYNDGVLTSYVCHYENIEEYECTDSVLYRYDENQRLIHETIYKERLASLYLSKEIDYSYNNTSVVRTTNGLSNGLWGDWVTLEKSTQVFDEYGKLLSIETETYNKPTTLETYSYNESDHILNILTQILADENWTNNKLLEYTYDGYGHLILAEIKVWQDGMWGNADRAVYELNEAGYPIIINFEKWNGGEWEQGTWKADFFIFSEPYLSRQNYFLCRKDAKRIEISYSATPMPNYDVYEDPIKKDFCTLHPNPTNGRVTITGLNLRQAEVVNTLGQRVAAIKGEGNQLFVDISNLPAGVYFVNVTDEKGRKCVSKVVKE